MEIEYILYNENTPYTVWIEVKYNVWSDRVFLGNISVTDENGIPVEVSQRQYEEIESFCYGVCEQDYTDRQVDAAELRLEGRYA